jgi:hypothetical protein
MTMHFVHFRRWAAFGPIACCLASVLLLVPCQAAKYDGKLIISAVDQQSGTPLAVRMQLRDGRGRVVRVRQPQVAVQGGSIYFEGEVALELRKGSYTFAVEAGPEFHTRQGNFSLDRHAEDSKEITFRRIVNMQQEGWWAGDLDVHHPLASMSLLMRAEHVDFAPVLTQENIQGKCKTFRDRSRSGSAELTLSTGATPIYDRSSALDRRRGGGLLLFGEAVPEDLCAQPEAGLSLLPVADKEQVKGHRVALTPFAWDLPIWLASGDLDAIGLIHRHSLANKTVDNEAWGKSRDRAFFPGNLGNGRWSEAIYHHVLECGLRIPPAAGSGSGSNSSPLGTNRVYVHCGEQFSREAWWRGLCAGRVMVTNGPLMRVQVEGRPPGHLFALDRGESRTFQIGLKLAFYAKSPVDYLEIVKNGLVVHEVRLDRLAKESGRLPTLTFDQSGWFLVRAMTGNAQIYQFACTGPYYVEVDHHCRISRKSVQFFLDWLDQAKEKFRDNRLVQDEIANARVFWLDLLERANAQ